MPSVSTDDVKQLGKNLGSAINNMKYQILTIGILILLIYYLNRLNKFHNP